MNTHIASFGNQSARYILSTPLPDGPPPSWSPSEEDKFRTLAENLPQMIFACDAQGRKNYCCQRYLTYTGFSSFEEVDRHWLTIIHPDDQKETFKAWAEAIKNKTTYIAEYRMRRHDGAYRHQLARAVPTINRDGQISGWVGTITDVHDQKANETSLRRNEKLAAAGRMAASLAHEINNPLASVTNAIYLALQDPELAPSTREYLNLADRELNRVARIAAHSLRFHQQTHRPRSIRLSELLNSAARHYLDRLQVLAIDLVCDYRTDAEVICRVDDMRQAFAQLIGNALDAMPRGGQLKIRIRPSRLWNQAESVCGFRITLADSGHGIAPDFLPHVLEAFTTTKKPIGTGLGLWIVDEIVRRHSGRISIRSSVDPHRHGTVVSILLPPGDTTSGD